MMKRRIQATLAIAGLTLATACATGRTPYEGRTGPDPSDGQIMTRADIERTRAQNGWEALQRSNTHLDIQYTRQGNEPRIRHRGVDSFELSPQVLLVIDGRPVRTLDQLRDIPAKHIDYIQIMSSRAASLRFGSSGGNGAVVVWTGPPPFGGV